MLTALNLNATNDTSFSIFLVAGIVYFACMVIAFLIGRCRP